MDFQINHFLWVVFSLSLGVGYAFFLYSGSSKISGIPRRLLFALRALAVAAITFLLFAPQVSLFQRTLEKPVIIFAQDNSASLRSGFADHTAREHYRASFEKLYHKLALKYQVDTLLLGDSVRMGLRSDLKDKSTDLSSLSLYVRNRYAGRNVGAIVLASDGLYNRGNDPLAEALSLKAPVYTVALGDTSARKDLRIANINYNEFVQAGNDFEVSVQVEAFQSKGQMPRLQIYRGREIVFSETLNIDSDDFKHRLSLVLPPPRTGTTHYTARLDTLQNEISVSNNISEFYVRAQDKKKNILIISEAPHPDISAIRQSLALSGDYKLSLFYLPDLQPDLISEADLLILYQLPSLKEGLQAYASLVKTRPILYVLGAQSDLRRFSSMQGLFDFKAAARPIEGSAVINPSFQAFSLSDSVSLAIADYGPLFVPVSDVRFRGNRYDLLYQKVGDFPTGRPLFSFSADSSPRFAVLAGEGIWRWRLQAFSVSGNHNAVDQLLRKTVQYLVADTDKRRFRVYSSQQAYTNSEPVILNAELYDEAFELVNRPDVSLTLRAMDGRIFSYQFTRTTNSYTINLGALPSGEYTYNASTHYGGMMHKDEGKILVSSHELEFQDLRANHQLLHKLARQSGGRLFYPQQLEDLGKAVENNELVKTVSYESKTVSDMIDVKWLLGLICLLIFCEWFLRKRAGDL